MTDITVFNPLLDWKLLGGSHEFPGPEGGTCINEAALVFAGFKYQRIQRTADLPQCFSRPLSGYAMILNDRMNDEHRQTLLPFVTRLAGSADYFEIETQRAQLIVKRVMNEVVFRYWPGHAEDFRLKRRDLVHWAVEHPEPTVFEVASVVHSTFPAVLSAPGRILASPVEPSTWATHLEILDAALKIGKQADPIETALIVSRVEAAKHRALAAV